MSIESIITDQFYRTASWSLERPLLPRKCDVSKILLWMTPAYKFTRRYDGPGTPVYITRWVSPHQFLLQQVKYS